MNCECPCSALFDTPVDDSEAARYYQLMTGLIVEKPRRRVRAPLSGPIVVAVLALFGGACGVESGGSTAANQALPEPVATEPATTLVEPLSANVSIPDEVLHAPPPTFELEQTATQFDEIKIGDIVDSSAAPPGVRPDGSFDLALVPDLIPVSIDGVVVGFIEKSFVYFIPESPDDERPSPRLLDRDKNVIGGLDEHGVPYLFEEQE